LVNLGWGNGSSDITPALSSNPRTAKKKKEKTQMIEGVSGRKEVMPERSFEDVS
jgi:hypothetical protein